MYPYTVGKKSSYTIWERLWSGMDLAQRCICVVSCLVIVGIVTATVVCRYFFKIDFSGSEELLWIIGFWMFFMGASLGSAERSHISADVLTALMKNERKKMFVSFIRGVITSGLSIYVAWLAVDLVRWSIRMHAKSPTLRFPVAFPQTGIALGCVLMAFYFLFYTVRDLKMFLAMGKGGAAEVQGAKEDTCQS
jgi:TRAP-type C4-dicarboxylate transport system permease small subunit